MRPSLNNFIESVQNPKVCLKTFKNIIPIRNGRGEPVMTVSEYTVKFLVEIDGEKYRLVCLLLNSPMISRRAWKDLAEIEALNSPYIASTRYYPQEVLVFYDNGMPLYHDVVLQKVPDGKPIDQFLIECGERNDIKSPRQVLRSLTEMSEWLFSQHLIHQKLHLYNVIVRPDNTVTLVNLDMGRKLNPKEFAVDHRARDRDNLSIGYLGVILYVSSCTPKTYPLLRQGIVRRLPDLKKVLPPIARAAEIMEMTALGALIKRLRSTNGRLPDRERLNRDLRAMISQLPSKDLNSKGFTYYPLRHLRARNMLDLANLRGERVRCMNQFDWMALPSDTLVRVESENKYFFVDTAGNRINDISYDFAYDFAEGRAVVVNGNDYALIDREGNTIIPFICEDMEWDPDNGVAIAMIDGKWGVFDRGGNLLIPMRYDWLGQFGNDLIVAQVNDCYGYLRRDGSTAIPFIYTDAYCFDNNAALVQLGDECFLIDTDGNRIEDELEKADWQMEMELKLRAETGLR